MDGNPKLTPKPPSYFPKLPPNKISVQYEYQTLTDTQAPTAEFGNSKRRPKKGAKNQYNPLIFNDLQCTHIARLA